MRLSSLRLAIRAAGVLAVGVTIRSTIWTTGVEARRLWAFRDAKAETLTNGATPTHRNVMRPACRVALLRASRTLFSIFSTASGDRKDHNTKEDSAPHDKTI